MVKATIVHRFVCTALHYFAPPCLPAVLSSFVLGHSGAAMLCVPKDFGRLISPDGAEFTTGMKQILKQMTLLPSLQLTLIDHSIGRSNAFTGASAVGGCGAAGAVSALEVSS